MAFVNAGRDLALQRLDKNGRFTIIWDATGNPQFSDDGTFLVLSLLTNHRGMWWADESGTRGSVLYLIKQDTAGTASQITGAVDEALQPALDDGRLSTVTRSAVRKAPGRYELRINWTTPQGVSGSLILPLTY